MGRAVQHVLVALGVALAGCSLDGLDTEYGGDGGAGDAPVDGCAAKENCTNGVDDNCDGLVDCADPSCTQAGFACTAATIPAGWSLVAYSANTRPVCPAGYGTEAAVIGSPMGAPDTCTCSCGGTSATCGGTASYNGYPNACSTGAMGVNLAIANGTCQGVATSITSGDYYQVYFASTAVAQQGSCTGTGQIASAPAPTFAAGATCAAPSMLGAGCTSGVCAPPTGTAFAACISHPGNVACPSFGFTKQTLVSTGNPGWVDKRTCGACPCATSLSCSKVTNVALFTNGNCSGGAAYNINTGCQLVNSSAGIGSYEVAYGVTGSATCQPMGSSPPGGSVILDTNVETVCCP
jgi:hypothetical protein